MLGLFVVSGAILFERLTSGQTSPSAAETIAKEKIFINENREPLPSKFKIAAAENARLKNNIVWTLGAREQRGWSLYLPLIQHLINTTEEAESSGFAESVARWQQQNALPPTGTLDVQTLEQMIKVWQSYRIVSKEVAAPETLFDAPLADFYDPSRDAKLLKVERETYRAYKRMIAAAVKDSALNLKTTQTGELSADEKRLKIISAFRSPEYQEKLRQALPNSSRTTLALFSAHFTGRALDIYVGGEPVTAKDANRAVQINTPAYKWLVKNAARFGFYPYYYEPWHWEYRETR